MNVQQALRKAQRLANRTGRPVTVIVQAPRFRRRNPDPEIERWLAEQAARGMRDPASRSFLPEARKTAAAAPGLLQIQEAGAGRRAAARRKPAQAALFSGEELGEAQRDLFRRRNPWITSRGRRLFLDEKGRIEKGGARDLQGVHIQDLATLARSWRNLRGRDCEAEVPKEKIRRYRNKREAMHAIEYGNRNLHDFLESIYANELPHNIDTYEEYRGRKFKTWAQAFADAVPARGDWGSIWDSPRFEAFRQAIEGSYDWPGGHLEPPEPVLVGRSRQAALQACEFDVDRALAGLLRDARTGRLGLEDAPF